MLRFVVVAAVALFAAQLPSGARASTLQYDLTLTATQGSLDGTGFFDVSAPLTSTGTNALTAFSVTIDNDTFTLGNELYTATATFSNGALTSLNYLGALVDASGHSFNLDFLGTDGLSYSFLDIGTNSALSQGSISAVAAPSVAPLPNTVVLFATGLLGFGLLMHYRRKKLA